jgi:predicted nucleic acid-binding protein
LSRDDVETLLRDIQAMAQIDPGGVGPTCPDPGDQHLWDLLASVPRSVLVTGERRLVGSGHFPGRIMTPREFVERYLSPSGQA